MSEVARLTNISIQACVVEVVDDLLDGRDGPVPKRWRGIGNVSSQYQLCKYALF
jgi:hypothetical protein